jgi:hypothetical protein
MARSSGSATGSGHCQNEPSPFIKSDAGGGDKRKERKERIENRE